LIPQAENKFVKARSIDRKDRVDDHYSKLELLTSIEYTSKVLLGAHYRQMQVSPVDYVLDCLETKITTMVKGDFEFDFIARYITNTSSSDTTKFKKFNLFKIERRGEEGRF